MKGEAEGVLQQLKQLLEKYPLELEVRRLESEVYVLQGDYLAAENLLRQILVLNENDLVLFSLARVLYLREQYHKVLPLTEKLMQKYPSGWESFYLHALTLHRLGDPKKALGLTLPFLKTGQGQGYLHRLVGDLYRYQSKEDEAQQIYRTGLDKFPGHVDLIDALSLSYIQQGKWDQARELLVVAIESENPLKNVFLDRLILISYQLGEGKKALSYLQQFQQKNDPMFRAQGLEGNQQLFSVASPFLEYNDLSFKLVP